MSYRICLCLLVVLGGPCSVRCQGASGSPELETAARQFVDLLAKGKYAAAAEKFDAVMKVATDVEALARSWKMVVDQAGPFQAQRGVRAESIGEYEAVFVTCEFAKGKLDVKVVFNRDKKVAGLFFVPTPPAAAYAAPAYVRRESFREEEVTLGLRQWPLAGTLSMPKGAGPFPGVVLVHGSGPHDRDESVGANKPFRDLAWGLASRKIAVLRYEKRTKTHQLRFAQASEATVKDETIDDALLAVHRLRQVDRVDKDRIVVVGHSLGGMLVPRIAKGDPTLAGFVIMAGPARPLEDLMLAQMSYLSGLDGKTDPPEKARLEKLKAQIAKIKDPKLSPRTPGLILGAPASYWLDLRGYDPPAEARKTLGPMLILQGQRDYQVTTADFAAWKESLSSRKNVRFKLYPGLNHLFIAGRGKPSPAEYDKPGHVAAEIIDDIAKWVAALPAAGGTD